MLRFWLCAFVASISFYDSTSAADRLVWQKGGWNVSAMTDPNGRFVGCAAVANYHNADDRTRAQLTLASYRNNRWAGLLSHSRASAMAGRPMALYVDGHLIHTAGPILVKNDAVQLGTISFKAIDFLAAGHALRLESGTGPVNFTLEGSAEALTKAVECVNAAVAEEQGRALGKTKIVRIPFTVSGGFMNMRRRPSLSAEVVATIPAGVFGLQQTDDCRQPEDGMGQSLWCPVSWKGETGWISSVGVTDEIVQVALPAGQPTGPSFASRQTPSAQSQPERRVRVSTGTSFLVGNGKLLTNAHVVNGCTDVLLGPLAASIPAIVRARDNANDLALVDAPSLSLAAVPVPAFQRHIRLGEEVAVFGYPLDGIVASSGNFARGSIAALAGLRDDTSLLQLMVPIQPGNSGGPVLDIRGSVVGVVVGKLDALIVAKATGSFPEQINFAIKSTTAMAFLEANGVIVLEADKEAPALGFPEVADRAKQSTFRVRCVRRD